VERTLAVFESKLNRRSSTTSREDFLAFVDKIRPLAENDEKALLAEQCMSFETKALKKPWPLAGKDVINGFLEVSARTTAFTIPSRDRNFAPIVAAGPSGIGKTQLIYNEGMSGWLCVIARCCPVDFFACSRMTAPLSCAWDLWHSVPDFVTDAAALRAEILDALMSSYFEVALEVLEHASRVCPAHASRLLLLAFNNDESDRRVSEVFQSAMRTTFESLRELRFSRIVSLEDRYNRVCRLLQESFHPSIRGWYLCLDDAQALISREKQHYSSEVGPAEFVVHVTEAAVRMCRSLGAGLYINGKHHALANVMQHSSMIGQPAQLVTRFATLDTEGMLDLLEQYFVCEPGFRSDALLVKRLGWFVGRPMLFTKGVFWYLGCLVTRGKIPSVVCIKQLIEVSEEALEFEIQLRMRRIGSALSPDESVILSAGTWNRPIAAAFMKAALYSDGIVRSWSTSMLDVCIPLGISVVYAGETCFDLKREPLTLAVMQMCLLHASESRLEWMQTLMLVEKGRQMSFTEESFQEVLAYCFAAYAGSTSMPYRSDVKFTQLAVLEHVVQLVSQAENVLESMWYPICPYIINCPTFKTRARKIIDMRTMGTERPFLEAFVDPATGELDDTLILTHIDRDAGVDCAFLVRNADSDVGAKHLVAIRVRNSAGPFADAVAPLHPATQYLSDGDRARVLTGIDLDPSALSPKRRAYEAFLEAHPVFKANWIRMPAFSSTLSRKLQDQLVKMHEQAAMQRSPVLALTATRSIPRYLQCSELLVLPNGPPVDVPDMPLSGIVHPRNL
jgi:hypothetical protein